VDDLYFGVKDVVFKAQVFNRHGTFDRIANKNMENLEYAYLHCDLLNKTAFTPISFKVKSPQIDMSSISKKACS
jgi:UDP-N-acetylenolpyruvoylglucosamine reductase